ncbi:MAG TPA: esterase-like activity of phytase family protein, partial [Hyphomicrobiaceae bacterium]|nr:esterase-like activity of phytase family protein [Hyphomicrobiaceae bacterium]
DRLPSNKGLEAVTVIKGGRYRGAILAFAERSLDANDYHRGWIWKGGKVHRLGLVDVDGFDITDAASLADGSVIVLERRFRWSEGVKFRLRLIRAEHIKPGALLSGVTLIRADMRYEIDNMEGLAIHQDRRGRTVLTLISDNNFNSILQRTLLLQFELPDQALARHAAATRTLDK